ESYHKHLNGRRFSTAPVGHAIMVAATDCPNKFKSRGDKIAELLFSCRVSRCIGCDHLELSVPGDDEANRGRGTTGDGGGGTAVDEDYEPNSVLLDSLRHLKLMSLNVDILKKNVCDLAIAEHNFRHNIDKQASVLRRELEKFDEAVSEEICVKGMLCFDPTHAMFESIHLLMLNI
ncbi:hypothetical protein ISN45_Aa04g029770, partial [Arabidopsis thaliana x Arabidopsis arenosa]